jgi:hypothetical protein
MRRTLVAIVSTAWFCVASTYEAKADQCDAVAGELAARVPGVNIGRRSSVAVFALHPAVKYSSIGCLNAKSVNFFADVETSTRAQASSTTSDAPQQLYWAELPRIFERGRFAASSGRW